MYRYWDIKGQIRFCGKSYCRLVKKVKMEFAYKLEMKRILTY